MKQNVKDAVSWTKFKETYIPLPILTVSILAKGYQLYFTKEHDGKTIIQNYRQALGYRWYGEKDLQQYQQMLRNSSFQQISTYAQRYVNNHKKAIKIAENISKKDWSKKTDQEIVEAFSRWIEASVKAYNFCYDYVILNIILPKEINAIILKHVPKPEKFNYYLSHIVGMDEPADIHLEQKEIGEMALLEKKNSSNKLSIMIKKHLQQFSYLKMFCFAGNPYTEEEIVQKVRCLARKSEEEIIQEMINPYYQLEKNKTVTQEFMKGLSQQEKEKIMILKKYLYCSVWGDQNYHKGPFLIRNLLLEICRRNHLSYNQLHHLTDEEIVAMVNNGATTDLLKTINERMKENAFVYSNGKTVIYTGKEMKEYLSLEIIEQEKLEDLTEVRGETAHPGKVKGRVRILKRIEDIADFPEGGILIASDTNPAHVPAMKKALAIVTNEGGMLSHAAIVSREMKKPCIIGTKVATKVFKDGDLVEVNADKGIVRKIKL